MELACSTSQDRSPIKRWDFAKAIPDRFGTDSQGTCRSDSNVLSQLPINQNVDLSSIQRWDLADYEIHLLMAPTANFKPAQLTENQAANNNEGTALHSHCLLYLRENTMRQNKVIRSRGKSCRGSAGRAQSRLSTPQSILFIGVLSP